MSSHPTADAFMRGYLREPADATTRLVFADWLEETGSPANTAWAHYIRAKIEASRHPFRSTEWRAGEVEAATHAPYVIARLTISATTFVGYPKSLLELLPAANICVRLTAFEFSRTILEIVPESVVRENVIIPFATQGRVLFFATAEPGNADTVQKLEFILNRDVIAVGADQDEIQAAINRTYGETEVENVDSLLLQVTFEPFVSVTQQPTWVDELDAPVPRVVNLIILEVIGRGLSRVRITPYPDRCELAYWARDEWVVRDAFPRRLLEPIARRFAYLAAVERNFTENGHARGEYRFSHNDAVYPVLVIIEPVAVGPTLWLDIADPIPNAE